MIDLYFTRHEDYSEEIEPGTVRTALDGEKILLNGDLITGVRSRNPHESVCTIMLDQSKTTQKSVRCKESLNAVVLAIVAAKEDEAAFADVIWAQRGLDVDTTFQLERTEETS